MHPLTPEEAEELKKGNQLIYDPDFTFGCGRIGPEGSRSYLEARGMRELDHHIDAKFGSDALIEYVTQAIDHEDRDGPAPNVEGLPLEVTVESVELHDEYCGWPVRYAIISLEELPGKFYHGLFMKDED